MIYIDEKIMQKAMAYRIAYDKGQADYGDKITEEVLADGALSVWKWNAAIQRVKRCGIYMAYYITEDCPYCNPDLVRIAEQLAKVEDENADTIGAPEPDEPQPPDVEEEDVPRLINLVREQQEQLDQVPHYAHYVGQCWRQELPYMSFREWLNNQ